MDVPPVPSANRTDAPVIAECDGRIPGMLCSMDLTRRSACVRPLGLLQTTSMRSRFIQEWACGAHGEIVPPYEVVRRDRQRQRAVPRHSHAHH